MLDRRTNRLLMPLLGIGDQLLCRLGPPVEDHILEQRTEGRLDLLIKHRGRRVDNTHIHSLADRMIEENSVHRLTYMVISPEREGKVADTTAHLRSRQMLLDPFYRPDEGQRITVVLLDARSDRQDIGIKNNILWIEAHPLGQEPVSPFANLDLTLKCIRLPLLVEGHHHRSGPQTLDSSGMLEEQRLTLLERYGVDNTLSLYAFEARLDHLPLR